MNACGPMLRMACGRQAPALFVPGGDRETEQNLIFHPVEHVQFAWRYDVIDVLFLFRDLREPGRIRKETQITPQLERIRDTAETPLTKQVQGAANSYAQPWRSIVLDSSPNRVCHATLHLGQDVPQARKNGCRNTAFQAATSLCKRQDVDGATVGHKRSNVLF
jgi:hypothetical protein